MKNLLPIVIEMLFSITISGQVGIGTTTPRGALDINKPTTNTMGLVLPSNSLVSNMVNPQGGAVVAGTMMYDSTLDCVRYYKSSTNSWSDCMSSAPTGTVSSLTAPASLPNAVSGTTYNQTGSIGYTGGNGGTYSALSIPSTGVTGLTATINSGTFATGSGTASITISGTPSSSGTANFTVNLGGQSVSFSVTVSVATTVVMAGNAQPWKRHNLGADTSLDPDIPVQGIHGNYYQWGRSTVVADTNTPPGAIAGWNTTYAPDGSWLDASKTVNDPCPSGFQVPTLQQWTNLANNTTHSNIGTFTASPSNFGSAKVFTSGSNQLTFPATGHRSNGDGTLFSRGDSGFYWTSTQIAGSTADGASFSSGSNISLGAYFRTEGFSIRCISQ